MVLVLNLGRFFCELAWISRVTGGEHRRSGLLRQVGRLAQPHTTKTVAFGQTSL